MKRQSIKRIALVGMPNTGKSTFFNRLTGARAKIGNWPGVTVELLSSKIIEGSEMVEIVDLPGIYDLNGFSEDEKIVVNFIENNKLDLLVVIGNASQIDRQLALTLKLQKFDLPIVLLLNMSDEAKKYGIKIDIEAMSKELQIPIAMMSAKFNLGIPKAKKIIQLALNNEYKYIINNDLYKSNCLTNKVAWLMERCVDMPVELPGNWTDKFDKILLHPRFGLPLFFLAMLLMFEIIYMVGAPLQDAVAWVLSVVKESRPITALIGNFSPIMQNFIIGGLYDGVGTVLSFLPVIILFFLCMAVVEDSGYLARVAFLMDAFMSRLGLDGRSFVMQLMGFGCNVPALMGTRIMRSKGIRLLTMLIIPFSLCSARLQVFVFLTTVIFSRQAAPLVLFSLYLGSFATAFLTAFLYRNKLPAGEPLLLELPPYRLPTIKNMLLHGWREIDRFLRQASAYIIFGVVLIWFLTNYPFDVVPGSSDTLAGKIADIFSPVFRPLGMDNLMTVVLLFGFVAKEIILGGMVIVYQTNMEELSGVVSNSMTWVQAYSFMIFTLLYTPCLSTVAVLKQESKSWAFTAIAVAWPLLLAWLSSFIFYQGTVFLLNRFGAG